MPDWFGTRVSAPPPVAGTLAALAVFGSIATLVAFDPGGFVTRLDASVSALVREPSSALFDRMMIGATLFGDFPLTMTMMLAIVSLLLASGRLALALHALVLFTLTKLLVSLFKLGISRARPLELYSGGDVYSFPSGHAASAAVLLGVVAILYGARERARGDVRGGTRDGSARLDTPIRALARRLASTLASRSASQSGSPFPSSFISPLALASAALAAVLVALSRVRLGAHWPSDVIASLALVTALLLPFAWHVRCGPPLPRRTALTALFVPVGGWLLYLFAFGHWAARFY